MSHWIYSAVLLAVFTGAFGLMVGGLVLRRVLQTRATPRPAIAWLLVSLAAMSLAQMTEQMRVLLFRLSFDGLIEPGFFPALYGATWNVVSSKVLASVALAVAGAVKLGLYCGRPDHIVVRWAIAAAGGTLAVWVALAWLLDRYLP